MTRHERAELVLHEDQASITTEWIPAAQVRISRRIVTEVHTLDVEVRREELVITHHPVATEAAQPFPTGRAPELPEPSVFVLYAEVPSVSLTVQPVERVIVTPTVVTADLELSVDLRAERVSSSGTGGSATEQRL